ncbi:MAG: DUF1488 family protein [Rhodospirillales bacterium]
MERSNKSALNFPNVSRSYDATRSRVRFWGYDRSIEILFFVEAAALRKLHPDMNDAEENVLRVFDAALERIHEAADKAYVRGRKGTHAYNLAVEDF